VDQDGHPSEDPVKTPKEEESVMPTTKEAIERQEEKIRQRTYAEGSRLRQEESRLTSAKRKKRKREPFQMALDEHINKAKREITRISAANIPASLYIR